MEEEKGGSSASALRRAYFGGPLFPARQVWNFFEAHAAPLPANQREFAFEFKGGQLSRYRCYRNAEEFVADLVRCAPAAIHVGAIYSLPPRQRELGHFLALRKEFVIDIDVSDYDDVRCCACVGSKCMCSKCWGFIVAAIAQMEYLLRQCCGYNQLFWFFSGRRGVHCWISDEAAMRLSNEERKALSRFLSPWTRDGEGRFQPCSGYLSSPAYIPLFNLGLDGFIQHVMIQNRLFDDPQARQQLAERFIQPVAGREAAEAFLRQPVNSNSGELIALLMASVGEEKMMSVLRLLIFVFTYPRIDRGVSASRNHLLKLPYGTHAINGCICVPLEVESITAFRGSPSLQQLVGYKGGQEAQTSFLQLASLLAIANKG